MISAPACATYKLSVSYVVAVGPKVFAHVELCRFFLSNTSLVEKQGKGLLSPYISYSLPPFACRTRARKASSTITPYLVTITYNFLFLSIRTGCLHRLTSSAPKTCRMSKIENWHGGESYLMAFRNSSERPPSLRGVKGERMYPTFRIPVPHQCLTFEGGYRGGDTWKAARPPRPHPGVHPAALAVPRH